MSALNTQDVFITTRLDTDTAFGVRVDNGEHVFINSKLVREHGFDEGETRKLVLTYNPRGPADTPWQAIGISMNDTAPEKPTPRVEVAKLEDRIVAYFDIAANEHAITAPALAENMGVTETEMQLALSRMHNAGEMAKAQVHCKGGQDKASWVLWAPAAEWFAW